MPPDPSLHREPPASDTLTVAELVRVLVERRRFLLIATLLGLLAGVLYVFLLSPIFRAQGVFNIQFVTFVEYKRFSTALNDRETFLEYATRSGHFSDGELGSIRRSISGPEALGRWIHPVFAITKTDVKDIAETKDSNIFTGVDIDVTSSSAELARRIAELCGSYVRDFILKGKIDDIVRPGAATSTADLTRKQIEMLRARFDFDQLEQRKARLESIAAQYPSALRETQRQVISTQDGGDRYLPPTTQVIGVEAQIVEARSDLAGLEREITRLEVLIDYYRSARAKLNDAPLQVQLATLDAVYKEVSARHAGQGDAARDALDTVRVDLDNFHAYDEDYLRFAGRPAVRRQLGAIVVWAPLLLAIAVPFLLAALLALMTDWWRRNRAAVLHG